MQPHAQMTQVVGQLQSQFRIEALQQALALQEQMHTTPQGLQQTCDFYGD